MLFTLKIDDLRVFFPLIRPKRNKYPNSLLFQWFEISGYLLIISVGFNNKSLHIAIVLVDFSFFLLFPVLTANNREQNRMRQQPGPGILLRANPYVLEP